MSFTIIDSVPCFKLIYTVATIKAASRLRESLCKLVKQDRQRLLVLMGGELQNCADLTIYLFETDGDVRIERLDTSVKTVKVFCPDKLPTQTALELAGYLLQQRGIAVG